MPDPPINAFALPGGYIGVHTGLILLAQNESELACVLAHEISHVTQHHMARDGRGAEELDAADARRRSRSPSSRRAPAARAAARPPRRRSPARRRWRSRTSSTSRARTNTRPTASASSASTPPASTSTRMATFMERLQRASRFVDGNAPSYLRTHPITYERIAEAQSRAQGMPYRQVPDSLDFHLVRALLRSYQGDRRRRRSRASTTRSPSTSTTTRSRRATASSRRCCAPRTSRAPRPSSRRSRRSRRRIR